MRYAIHAGSAEIVGFQAIPKRVLASLEAEFGSAVRRAATVDPETAYVDVVFGAVRPPREAICVGRTACYEGTVAYVNESGAWLKFELEELFAPTGPCTVHCGLEIDPVRLVGKHVEPIMRLRALFQGDVFVHSSSVALDDNTAAIFAAWGNTGKTNLVLELREHGLQILSDDWTLIRRDGTASGYPRPLNLLNYNFERFPFLRRDVPVRQRLAIRADAALRRLLTLAQPTHGTALRISDILERGLEKLSNTHVPFDSVDTQRSQYVPSAIFEVRKVRELSEARILCPAKGLAARQSECFIEENRPLLTRLAEARHAGLSLSFPDESAVRDTYVSRLEESIGTRGLKSRLLELPCEASRPQLEGAVRSVLADLETL